MQAQTCDTRTAAQFKNPLALFCGAGGRQKDGVSCRAVAALGLPDLQPSPKELIPRQRIFVKTAHSETGSSLSRNTARA